MHTSITQKHDFQIICIIIVGPIAVARQFSGISSLNRYVFLRNWSFSGSLIHLHSRQLQRRASGVRLAIDCHDDSGLLPQSAITPPDGVKQLERHCPTGKSHPWTNTSVGGNFRRTFRTIGPYEFPPKFVWTNGAQSSLKVSVLTGIAPKSALPCPMN